MSSIVQGDTSPIDFFMADSTDPTGNTGKAGLLPADITFKLSIGGGAAFNPGTGTITAKTGAGNGWFRYTPVAGDVATLGDISFEATATGCFTWRDNRRVQQAGAAASDYSTERAAKLDNLDAAITTRLATAGYTAPPAATAIVDAFAARHYRGGSNASPTFAEVLASCLMEFVISGTTLTVKHSDGSTAFTRTLTRDQTLQIGAILQSA